MTKKVFYTLLGVATLLVSTTACNRSVAPEELKYAHVTAAFSGNSSGPRALFVGGDAKDSPSKIKWGEVNENLPMLVYLPTGTETKAKQTTLKLKSANKGDLTIPYEDTNVKDNKVKYFATSGANTKNATKGAFITNASSSLPLCAVIRTEVANEGKVDMTNPEVGWPLISSYKKGEVSHLWSSVDVNGGGSVDFRLFGNMFLIEFNNLLGEEGYDANSKDQDESKHPQLIVESNGMAFGGSHFTNDVYADDPKPWTIQANNSVNKVTYVLSDLDFSTGAKRQVVPVWFRPMKPTDNKPFNITITWRVYNKVTGDWDESVQKLKSKAKIQANGTIFPKNDGCHFRTNGGVAPKIGVEFGSNSFFTVDINIPPFD
nr:hypothetical protein [uncultured Porphyromonas sp.]